MKILKENTNNSHINFVIENEKGEKFYLFDTDWNGEEYVNSTKKVDFNTYKNANKAFKPIYKEIDDQFEIVDFEEC